MNKEEFKILTTSIDSKNLITVDRMVNKEDRTLIHGYTCERHTFDVELIDGVIEVWVTPFGEKPKRVEVKSNHDFVPDKRVYPDQSDFEFCMLLQQSGIDIPFTTFQER